MKVARDKFKVGDRVKPSRKGIGANLWIRRKVPTGGVVVSLPHPYSLCVAVRWDGRKTASPFHMDFVSVVRKSAR